MISSDSFGRWGHQPIEKASTHDQRLILAPVGDEKTLTDNEVEQEMNQIISTLETKIGAVIRAN